jgi:hypothetical protein
VTRRLADLAGAAVLLTVVLVVLLVLRPISTDLTLHVYLLCITGLVLAGALAALPERGRSDFELALRRRTRAAERPPQLERVKRAVTLGVGSAFELHARLRPLLRDAAAARLAAGRGVDLDSPAGRAAVGEEAWEHLRPDREQPEDRFAAGVDEAALRRIVATLEEL